MEKDAPFTPSPRTGRSASGRLYKAPAKAGKGKKALKEAGSSSIDDEEPALEAQGNLKRKRNDSEDTELAIETNVDTKQGLEAEGEEHVGEVGNGLYMSPFMLLADIADV